MNVIELFVPRSSLRPEQRRRLGERLVTDLISADGAPADVVGRGRDLTWVVVHEPEVWTAGGRPVDPSEPPRYLVRVTVPGGHLDEGMRAELVRRVTRTIADVDDDPERLYRRPVAWVHVDEVPSGNLAAFGRVLTTPEIMRMVVAGETPGPDDAGDDAGVGADAGAAGAGVDTLVDPICGMAVTLDAEAITLQAGGTLHAFCSPACREIFARRA